MNPRKRRSNGNTSTVPATPEFIYDSHPHPLRIPIILFEVAKHLPFKDLLNFRLVCGQWMEIGGKFLQKKSKLRLKSDLDVMAFNRIKNPSCDYEHFEFRGSIELNSLHVQRLLKRFGNQIRSIYLNRISWEGADLYAILVSQLPKLEELSIETRAYTNCRLFNSKTEPIKLLPSIRVLKLKVYSYMVEISSPFVHDLLLACPNVVEIRGLHPDKRVSLPIQFIEYICQQMNYDAADDVVNMPYAGDMAIAEAVVETPATVLPKLQYLGCNLRLFSPSLNRLMKKNFPLKEIDLTVMSDITTPQLHMLLQSLKTTLTDLKLRLHPRCRALTLPPVPHLPCLKSLTLKGYKQSLRFVEDLPQLDTLILYRMDFPKSLVQDEISCTLKEVKILEIHEEFAKRVNSDTVSHMKRLFPNLMKIRLENVNNSGLSCLIKSYPGLRELHLPDGHYSDQPFISNHGDIAEPTEQPSTSEKAEFYPGIASLSDLKYLQLASPSITDACIVEGVSFCSALRVLNLLSYGITDLSITVLLTRLKLTEIKTVYCNLSPSVIDWGTELMSKSGKVASLNEYHGPMKQVDMPKFIRRHGLARVMFRNTIGFVRSGDRHFQIST